MQYGETMVSWYNINTMYKNCLPMFILNVYVILLFVLSTTSWLTTNDSIQILSTYCARYYKL